MCSDDAPWTLSRVSRRWRALVLSSPGLWSTVNIRPLFFTPDAEHTERLSACLALYLRRSANCDLSIRVAGFVSDPQSSLRHYDDDLLERCCKILFSTTKRWRTAELTDLSYALYIFFSGISFDRLTDLKVIFPESPDPILEPIRWLTPNLTHLTLLEKEVGVMEVTWDKLTYFLCDKSSFQHLPKCVALEKLMLPPIPPEFIHFSALITLPSLRSLDLWHKEADYSLSHLSDLLVLPSLNTLRLNFNDIHPSVYPSFHGAIHRIRNLSLHIVYPPPGGVEPLLAFLAECVCVTALYIDGGMATDEVLTALDISADPLLLPLLTMLAVDIDLLNQFPNRLMDVVLSRTTGGSHTLTQLTVMQYGTQGPWEDNWRYFTKLTPEMEEKWTLVKRSVRVSQVDADVFPF